MPEPERLAAAEVARFRDLIRARSGLTFPPSRQADLEHVVAQTLASTGLADPAALLALLGDAGRGESILQALIADLTVGETYFFRNQPQFHALEHHILPELIARRRPVRQLRLWSAGCSTGEEPYSLAILLERLIPDLADWNVQILATDLNPKALVTGRAGRYGPWSFRHVPAEIKDAYFVPRGEEFEILPRLRSRVTFARLNLVEDAFPSLLTQTCNLDLILCRNVLIYFDAETVARLVERFHEATAEGGWLVVGHAEPSQLLSGRFAAHNFPGTVMYRKEAADAVATTFWQEDEPPAANAALTAPLPASVRAPERRAERAAPVRSAARDAHTLPARVSLHAAHPERSPYQQAKQSADRKQWDQAEHWIAVALQQAPFAPAPHYLRGLILLEKAEPEAALASLRSCVFADSSFVLGHLALADVFARQGQQERARKALETAGRLVAALPAHEAIPEGDGLTAGRLLAMVNMRKQP